MATLPQFYREIRPHVKGCADITIDYALMRAIRELCRDSWCWQQTYEIAEVADAEFYDLTQTSVGEVVGIVAVERDGNNLTPARPIDLNPQDPGTPLRFAYEPPQTLQVHPAAKAANLNTLEVRVAMQPKEDQGYVPELIQRLYKTGVVYGALHYLLSLPEERWTNPNLALQYGQMYHSELNDAKGQRMRGHKSQGLTMARRSFL